MKLLTFVLLMLPTAAHNTEMRQEWWWQGVIGACTKTDMEELGECGKLEVSKKPNWSKRR